MIDYDNKNSHMLITCDTCGKEFEEYGDWPYCVQEAKLDGWIVIKKKGVFHHYCSENCKDGFKPEPPLKDFINSLSDEEQDDFFNSASKAGGLIK